MQVFKLTAVESRGQTPVTKTGKVHGRRLFCSSLCPAHLLTTSIATFPPTHQGNLQTRPLIHMLIPCCPHNGQRQSLHSPYHGACQGRSGLSTKPQSGRPDGIDMAKYELTVLDGRG